VLAWSSFYDIISLAQDNFTFPGQLVLPQVVDFWTPGQSEEGSWFTNDLEITWSAPIAYPLGAGSLSDPTLGVVELAPNQFPTAIGKHEVLRGWAFAPFETALEDDNDEDEDEHPFKFTVTAAVPGLEENDEVSFLFAHYVEDIAQEQIGSVTASVVDLDGEWGISGEVPILSILLAVR